MYIADTHAGDSKKTDRIRKLDALMSESSINIMLS